MQSDFAAFTRQRFDLQKLAIRVQLERQQIRYIENAGALAEIFTNASFFSKGVSHRDSSDGSAGLGRKPPDSMI